MTTLALPRAPAGKRLLGSAPLEQWTIGAPPQPPRGLVRAALVFLVLGCPASRASTVSRWTAICASAYSNRRRWTTPTSSAPTARSRPRGKPARQPSGRAEGPGRPRSWRGAGFACSHRRRPAQFTARCFTRTTPMTGCFVFRGSISPEAFGDVLERCSFLYRIVRVSRTRCYRGSLWWRSSKMDCHAVRRSTAPAGANRWLRVSMC